MLSSGAVFVVYKDLLLESPCSTGPRARPSDGSRSTTGHISDSGAGCGKVEILETLHMEYKMKRFLSWVGLALLLAIYTKVVMYRQPLTFVMCFVMY